MPKKRPEPRLTMKQEAFVREYLVCANAAEAARRAGYNAARGTAFANIGQQLLQHPLIVQRVVERQRELDAKSEITKEKIVQNLAEIAFAKEEKSQDRIAASVQLAKLHGHFDLDNSQRQQTSPFIVNFGGPVTPPVPIKHVGKAGG